MTPPHLPMDEWLLRKLHCRTLSPTWPKLRLSSNKFARAVQYQGVCVDWGTIPIKGSPHPPIKACLPILWSPP